MKRLYCLLLIAVASIATAYTSPPDKGVTMLNKFYTAYISASSVEDGNLEAMETKLSALRRKYCTAACLKQFKALVKQTDADPIVKAQDSYKELIKTLEIKKDPKKQNRYAVSYTDIQGNQEKITIYVTLTAQNGMLKIAYLQ